MACGLTVNMITNRIFDLALCVLIAPITLPLILAIYTIQSLSSKYPAFHYSVRAKQHCAPFKLIKFRTMKPINEAETASGGHQDDRINTFGRFLRKVRLDELPQIWNILRGDMSFVGPRPPLLKYVNSFPETYERVLEAKPGITGLATLKYHQREKVILSKARSSAETEEIYVTICIPQKARLDLLYCKNKSICFDLQLLLQTMGTIILPKGTKAD